MLISQEQFDHIVGVVANWLHEAPTQHRREFISMEKDRLILYHHTLGRDIRNEFGLWQYKWTPQLENGVDVSPDHPDSVSMRIIERVWENEQHV